MNAQSLRPSQLAALLASTIRAQLPVLIIGGPGTAKTSIVEQATAAADNDIVISHPAVADPTDAKGFPWIEKGKATFVPFGETLRVLESKKPTVWFMDDLGQAPPAVQASFMPWLLARQVGGRKLPDHVTIIAATNRRTDRAGVSGILEPVKSRFATIVELEPELNEWCQWAMQQAFMPPELIAFLRFVPDKLNQFVPSADLINCPSPRTWASAGRILSLGLPSELEQKALTGAVGEGAATELMAYLLMYRALPNIDSILMDPDSGTIPTQVSVLYAVSTALAARANVTNFARVVKYVQRLVDAGHGDFAALTVRDACRRHPEITQAPAFARLMSGDLGQLIGGGV